MVWIVDQTGVTFLITPAHAWYVKETSYHCEFVLIDTRDGSSKSIWTGTKADCEKLKRIFDASVGAIPLIEMISAEEFNLPTAPAPEASP